MYYEHYVTFASSKEGTSSEEGSTQLCHLDFFLVDGVDFYEVEHKHDDYEQQDGWRTQYIRSNKPITSNEEVIISQLPGVIEFEVNQERGDDDE